MTMRVFCFSVDLDRDVNVPVPGLLAAASIDRGQGDTPRFSSSGKGLALLSDMLDDLGIRATFFAEATTLRSVDVSNCLERHEVGIHGVDHEDLTGANAPVPDLDSIIRASMDAAEEAVGRRPICSRSPFMAFNSAVSDAYVRNGVKVDSSTYAPIAECCEPRLLPSGLVEIPVFDDVDSHGKRMGGYLWPMHEGRRTPGDYLAAASRVDDGIFSVATHTWHMCESRRDGPMGPERLRQNLESTEAVLSGIIDMGFTSMTLPDASVARNLIIKS